MSHRQEWVFFSDSAGNSTDGAKFTASRTGCFGLSGVFVLRRERWTKQGCCPPVAIAEEKVSYSLLKERFLVLKTRGRFFASPSRGGGSGMGFAGAGGVSRSPFFCPFRCHHPIVAAFVLKEKAPIFVRIRAWVRVT